MTPASPKRWCTHCGNAVASDYQATSYQPVCGKCQVAEASRAATASMARDSRDRAERLGPRWNKRLKRAALWTTGAVGFFGFAVLAIVLPKEFVDPKSIPEMLFLTVVALSITSGCFGIWASMEALCTLTGGKRWNTGVVIQRHCSFCNHHLDFFESPGLDEVIACPKCRCLIYGSGR